MSDTAFRQTLEPPLDGDPTTYHIAGWVTCSFYKKSLEVANAMQVLYPEHVKVILHGFVDSNAFKTWLTSNQMEISSCFGLESPAMSHTSSPFVWSNSYGFIGGYDDLVVHFRTNATKPPKRSFNSVMKVESPHAVNELSADENVSYDYDLVVIGGGSGGLACSKEASQFGKKVCVLDFVKPSPHGTSWGLGGTCVNVGCIPKKLMHQSGLIGDIIHHDSHNFGWKINDASEDTETTVQKATFHWDTMVASVNNYIKGLNFKYKVELRDKKVKYENFLATFVDSHTVELTNPKKKSKVITSRHFVVAVGGRPRSLGCPGSEYSISSDDIFWMKNPPGKTLVVGASYVALECAGFLKAMGYDVTVMVRSILLRGFDQDIASKIGEYMELESRIKFIKGSVPSEIVKLESGQLRVSWRPFDDPESIQEEIFDTVLNATGRNPDVGQLNLERAGVALNTKTGKIAVNNHEQTSAPNIFAIGDVIDAPELTPVAIQAGRLLARRLYNDETTLMDYEKICTAVFTPIEYGCCGLSEEAAIEKYGGQDQIEVYHQHFTPLEWSLAETRENASKCYTKVICVKSMDEYVVGFHYLGPNAGEITQAMGLAMKLGFTYEQMVSTVGIHPTTAEAFTTLTITKSSGASAESKGC